jgi:protein-tyrosine-phosphatase
MTGWPADPAITRLLRGRGLELGPHRARQVDPDLTRRNDLILTATYAHREWIATTTPAAARRTFTLAEFAEIVEDAPDDLPPRDLVAWAAEHRPPRPLGRGRSTRRGGAPGDIIDPYGRSDAVFEQSIAQIEPLVKGVAAALRTRS